MHNYKIRVGMAPDAGAISAICSNGFFVVHETGFEREDLLEFCKFHYAPAAIEADLSKEDRFYLVLECEGEVVGCLRMAPPTLSLAEKTSVDVELARFYLNPAHRSGGWGGKLLEMAEKKCHEQGLLHVWLHVFIPNKRAQAFYFKHNYSLMGEEQLVFRNSRPTGLVLRKSLY